MFSMVIVITPYTICAMLNKQRLYKAKNQVDTAQTKAMGASYQRFLYVTVSTRMGLRVTL